MAKKLNYIDLFAGASGMSEGFIRSGYIPVAHVEMNNEACYTIKTRTAFHYLKSQNRISTYYDYLSGKISRDLLYNEIPADVLNSILQKEISARTINELFTSIDTLLDSQKVDVIIGGPPCQAYSLVGISRDPKQMKWDRRKFLFRYYAEFLKRYKPKYFVFENVLGLLTQGNAKYLNEMLQLFGKLGYSTDYKKLHADDYGVLQKRRRVVIIGRRGKRKFTFPAIEPITNGWQIRKDLFFDLPDLKPGQEMNIARYTQESKEYLKGTEIRNGIDFVTQHITRNHNDRDLEIYSIAIDKWMNDKARLKYTDLPKRLQTHNNKSVFLDRFKVVDPFGHSHTLVAHIAKDGHYYIYPDQQQIRSISVREAARIQSFPDDYFFEGGRTAAFKQIGNAVPPLMAQAIAKTILNLF
jgi:DNA (cytosine-5)-methyltransferase 1